MTRESWYSRLIRLWRSISVISTMLVMVSVSGCSHAEEPPPSSLPKFSDVSQEVGVSESSLEHGGSFGPIWIPLDSDPWLDLVILNHGDPPSFYLNSQGENFAQRYRENMFGNAENYPQWGDRHGAACGDYDNDGDADLFITHGAYNGRTLGVKRDELLRNDGSMTFTDVTRRAGVTNSQGRARTPTWVNVNNDGWLDLYLGNMLSPNVLYLNNGDGTFSPAQSQSDLRTSQHKGVRQSWQDYNRDGFQDVLVVRPLTLLRNNGDGTFTNVTRQAGMNPYESGEAMAVAWGDYNNDGYPDVFITAKQTGENTLYENNGNGTFTRIPVEFGPPSDGLGMGVEWGDIDNDRDLDLLITESQRVRLVENTATGLVERSTSTLPALNDIDPKKRGDLSLGDYNHDGYLDLAIATWQRHHLFRNEGSGHHWLNLTLQGVTSNRQGFGAKVWIERGDSTIYREYTGSNGTFFSTGCGPMHLGLGNQDNVDLFVKWPSGLVERFENVKANQHIELKEGKGLQTKR